LQLQGGEERKDGALTARQFKLRAAPAVLPIAAGSLDRRSDREEGRHQQGESYGNDFDAFIKDKLTVERTDGVDAAFKYLLDGKADYLTAGYYSGLAEGPRPASRIRSRR